MRFRTTIILILLLLGLGAYVYWVELPKAEQEAKKKTLFEFTPADTTEVDLAYADREIVLKKSGDEWRLAKPIDAPADQTTAKNLVNAIAECEVKKTLDETATDLPQYGLDQPFVKVTVKLKDKELPTILVGKNAPVGFSTYLKKADDPKIILTSSSFRSGMDKKVKDLRDKTIVAFEDKDVHKVQLHGEAKDIALVQKDDNWSIEQPAAYAADATAMRSFLSTLRSMRAVDFPADQPTDLSTYGLDNPRLTVTLYLGKENAEKRLLLGKETDKKEVYVQASGQPTVYTVSDWVFRDLNKSLADFRDKTVFAFDRDKITAVDVARKEGGQFKLVRGDDKQWRVEGVGGGKPAETTISQFIGDLHDLKGYEIAADNPTDLAQFGLDQPLLKATVVGEGDKPVGTVLAGSRQTADGKKEYTAMIAGGPTVFLVRDYLFTRLDKHPQDFVEKPTPTIGAATPGTPVVQSEDEPEEGGVEDEPPDTGGEGD
jgi:hypothetical protein